MRNILFLLTFLCSVIVNAQQFKKDNVAIVEYVEGPIEAKSKTKTFVYYNSGIAKIYQETKGVELSPLVAKEVSFINYKDNLYTKKAELKDNKNIHYVFSAKKLYSFELTDEYEEILGYKCRRATKTSFSNKIDVWFTTEAGIKGTPVPEYGLTDGLILKISRNGDVAFVASDIQFLKKRKAHDIEYGELGKKVSYDEYRYFIRENYVTRINIFDDEKLAWDGEKENPKEQKLNHTYRLNQGTLLLRKVKLPEVTSDYNVFIKVKQYSNGDAYDRTGTVFVIPDEKEISAINAFLKGERLGLPDYIDSKGKRYKGIVSDENYDCPIELMRFFTPFGIRKYNEKVNIPGMVWRDEAIYKQDVSHLLPKLRGEVWIGICIGNYDKGGYKVSLDMEYYPGAKISVKNPNRQYVQPLFNNINRIPGTDDSKYFAYDSLELDFNVPYNVKNLKLMYITTGHGGWGQGDEFVQKVNTIIIDDKKEFSFIPWRTDCATYRDLNPASGNFWNGLSSSDYSRSNWAPGTTTNPVIVPLFDIKPGKHKMKIAIPQGPKGCAWNVSGVLIGEYK